MIISAKYIAANVVAPIYLRSWQSGHLLYPASWDMEVERAKNLDKCQVDEILTWLDGLEQIDRWKIEVIS